MLRIVQEFSRCHVEDRLAGIRAHPALAMEEPCHPADILKRIQSCTQYGWIGWQPRPHWCLLNADMAIV